MELYYWGEDQQYGPFGVDEYGYPNAGEVIRHYRRRANMDAATFGRLYGEQLGEEPKSRIWVLTMERTNHVPMDITRRRVIAKILSIPPALLGISAGLNRTLIASPLAPASVPLRETFDRQMINEHSAALEAYFNGYYHRHGHATLDDLAATIRQLETLVSSTSERNRRPGIVLLSRYHHFSANIAREQQKYSLALYHSDEALKDANEADKIKPDGDLVSIKLLMRGLAAFEREVTRIEPENFDEAISYLDSALSYAPHVTPYVHGALLVEWGLVHAYQVHDEGERTRILKAFDKAYNYHRPNFDSENLIWFSLSWYHLTRAEALIKLKMYTEALGELEVAEEQTPINMPRRFAYIDALRARAYLGLGEYDQAFAAVEDAVKGSEEVKSLYNLARLAQVQQQLEASSYGKTSEVVHFGRRFRKTHAQLFLPQVS